MNHPRYRTGCLACAKKQQLNETPIHSRRHSTTSHTSTVSTQHTPTKSPPTLKRMAEAKAASPASPSRIPRIVDDKSPVKHALRDYVGLIPVPTWAIPPQSMKRKDMTNSHTTLHDNEEMNSQDKNRSNVTMESFASPRWMKQDSDTLVIQDVPAIEAEPVPIFLAQSSFSDELGSLESQSNFFENEDKTGLQSTICDSNVNEIASEINNNVAGTDFTFNHTNTHMNTKRNDHQSIYAIDFASLLRQRDYRAENQSIYNDLPALFQLITSKLETLIETHQSLQSTSCPSYHFIQQKSEYISTARDIYDIAINIFQSWQPIVKSCKHESLSQQLDFALVKVQVLAFQLRPLTNQKQHDLNDMDEARQLVSCSQNLVDASKEALTVLEAAQLKT